MSMLPKLSETIVTSDGYTKTINTMGDTTHVMVNHFCYHINQMRDGEVKDACVALLLKSRQANAMQRELLQRKNLAYIKMKELREQARLAQIEFDLASKDLENHKVELAIKRMAQ